MTRMETILMVCGLIAFQAPTCMNRFTNGEEAKEGIRSTDTWRRVRVTEERNGADEGLSGL